MKQPKTEGAQTSLPSPGQGHPPRVLVVDDEPLIRYAVAHTLAQGGAKVVEFETAEAAVDAVAELFYDLCFLDLQLPGMDGFAAMVQIQRCSPQTRIAVMSGSVLNRDQEAHIARYAGYFLPKPFDLRTVTHIAARALAGEGAPPLHSEFSPSALKHPLSPSDPWV